MSMLFRAFYLFDIGAVIRKNSNFSANPKTRKWLRACLVSSPAGTWQSTQLFYTAKTLSCNSSKLPLLLERAGERRIKSTS